MRPVCADCKTEAPSTNTVDTLVSRTGWRLTRAKGPDGTLRQVWRCPTCWEPYRAKLREEVSKRPSKAGR
ncbi:MAG: hypothetical protein JOZ69_09395 [Myxococcales bacterium]|nr:hypothetical protein [Myxococcales bacterium]